MPNTKPTTAVNTKKSSSVPQTTPKNKAAISAPASKKTIQKKILPKNPIEQKAPTAEAEKNKEEKIIAVDEPKKIKESFAPPKEKISNRIYRVLKTIDIEDDKVTIDIYDNGQIDGDTISIFLNDKLVVSKRMLTAKPINIQLKLEEDADMYDVIMYAENLGTIPPNTALMIVQTKNKRYEINITSTEQTSGAVRFRYKK